MLKLKVIWAIVLHKKYLIGVYQQTGFKNAKENLDRVIEHILN